MSRSEPLLPAVEIALEPFGLRAIKAMPLAGYHDECFEVETEEGRFVLKIAPPETREDLIDFEASVVRHALDQDPELPVPPYRRTRDGDLFATTDLDGSPRHVRVIRFADGLQYADFRPHSSGLRISLGRVLGRLDAALLDFEHPAMNRYFEWDLARAADTARLTHHISNSARRIRVEGIFSNHDDISPILDELRRSVIHSDANDYNILVSTNDGGDARISALLDFGDTVMTHTVNEAAIACAYAMLHEADPIAAAADVIRGYHEGTPLAEREVEVLYSLILTRLAVSATLSARWTSENPGHEEEAYQTVSQVAVWDLLDRLDSVSPDFAYYVFRDACGMVPCRRSRRVVDYLRSIERPASILPENLQSIPLCVIDLSVGSTDPAARYPEGDATVWSRIVQGRIANAGARVGVGRYNEARACYTSHQFATPTGETRTVHLGIDLFSPPGTPVCSPLDGTVHSLRDNDLPLDYGPTVVLQHQLPGGESFFTLYGHLGRSTPDGLRPGREVGRGQQIGEIGASSENGGWPPHLHFQVIVDLLGMEGNFPGVTEARARNVWLSICPDPNLILRIPDEAFPETAMDTAEVRSLRQRHTGSNLSLSYRSPLHIVRGTGQYLFDAAGRRYLDCVNNVAHVGHSHPRVVDAIARQAAVLNTNTRYLHQNLARYAERLSATLPEQLSVCYFVNSGSEANDLALRMARTHTKGSEFVVLGSAYHGHLISLIEVSPYKSRGPGGSGPPTHVHEMPAPDMFRGPYAHESDPVRRYTDETISILTDLQKSGTTLAAFIAESALSCAGQIFLPPGYLASVYDLIRSAGGICIADEVQVGFGRVGSHFWAFETQGVVPDIVTMGKPIGNGHPLGAVVTTPTIAASFSNGMEYFNTFGGNPVSCAAGLAVLDVIRDEGLQAHAEKVGIVLLESIRAIAASYPVIGDVRGSGLFVGVEIVRPGTHDPEPRVASYVVNRLRDRGVLLSTDGPDHNVIKIKPPMVFDERDASQLIDRMRDVLSESYVAGVQSGMT